MINLFYIGDFDFSSKDASTLRIINNCKTLEATHNYNIKIIGKSNTPYFSIDGISILNVKRGKLLYSKLYYYVFRAFFIIQLLAKIIKRNDMIIYYGVSSRILLPLLFYCKTKKIKLIADVVEWYDYRHLPFGRFGPIAIDTHLALTKLIPKCNSVITISSYLQNYYQNKGMKTVRIPVLIDTANENLSTDIITNFDSNYLNLIYAGSHGKKDLLFNVIEAVEQLNSEGILIRFHILGSAKAELESRMHKHISEAINCYGKVVQEKVPIYLKQADFSVLLRPNMRFAQAGFPTKFVESLNAGLPIIANYTSDLELYLKDGYNGFVLKDQSVYELISKIKHIKSISRSTLNQLKINAKLTAIENFDFRLYTKILDKFVSSN